MTGVYYILHIPSGRRYIGSSLDIATRWRRHKRSLEKGTHHAKELQTLWSEDGEDAFEFVIVARCPRAKLVDVEQRFLDREISPLNGSRVAAAPSQDPSVAAKIAQAKKGQKHPANQSATLKKYWGSLSPEERKAWSDACHAKFQTPEHRRASVTESERSVGALFPRGETRAHEEGARRS